MSSGNIYDIDVVDQLLKNVQQQLNENTDANDPKSTSPLTASRVLVSDGSGKISSATETSANLTSAVSHISSTSNPHSVTKAQLNLDTTDDVTFADITCTELDVGGDLTVTGNVIPSSESITATDAGVAASVAKTITLITTNGDSDLDNVTLADGSTVGQQKIFAVEVAGNVADSVKITPTTMVGGSIITFAADPTGLGCHMTWTTTGWVVTANNGGVIS